MRKNLLLLLFVITFMIISLEIVLRIINPEAPKLPEKPKSDWALVPERIWTEHHEQLGWAHQRNKQAILKIDAGETEIRTNSIGLRGQREYSIERAKDKKRIVMLGDSFVFGWGVLDHQTFSSNLEKQFPNLEVLNLGVAGYGLDQIYLSYRVLGKQFHPDYVFVGIFPEDFWRSTRAFSDTGHAKPYFKLTHNGKLELQNTPVPPPFSLRTNQFPPVIEYGPLQKFLMQSTSYRFLRSKILKLGRNLGWVDPDMTDEWILGQAILKQLIREIKADGAKPVLLIIPVERWMHRNKPESLHRSIIRFAKRERVELIDFTPVFMHSVAQSNVNEYYIPSDQHWTAKGHELASQVLAAYLMKRGFINEKFANSRLDFVSENVIPVTPTAK